MRRIALTLREDGNEDGYHAMSGEDGSFSFPAVAPGEYRLEAERWNVKGLFTGAGSIDRRRVPIVAGTHLAGLVAQVALPGLIRGKVSYEDGGPAWARIERQHAPKPCASRRPGTEKRASQLILDMAGRR